MFGESMTEIAKKLLKPYIVAGEVVIDATAGNGFDTVFLAEQVGIDGQVYAFDLQKEAILATKNRLLKLGLDKQVTLIQEDHRHLKKWVKEPIGAIMFNLGYLPKGDKKIITRKESTLEAVDQGLTLLKVGGVISILSYYGHKGGMEEKEGLEAYLKNLSSRTYEVIKLFCFNRQQAPMLYLIKKLRGF